MDAITVLVNKNNPLGSITKQQLADVFSGKIADWSQIGGSAGPIYLYAPDDNSGTFDTFKSIVLSPRPLSPRALRYEDATKLSDAVAADTNGIGIAGRSFVRSCKVLAIAEPGKKALMPDTFAVATGDYPLSRRLYLYTPSDPQNKWTRKFVD